MTPARQAHLSTTSPSSATRFGATRSTHRGTEALRTDWFLPLLDVRHHLPVLPVSDRDARPGPFDTLRHPASGMITGRGRRGDAETASSIFVNHDSRAAGAPVHDISIFGNALRGDEVNTQRHRGTEDRLVSS